jgi:hypothetical protein
VQLTPAEQSRLASTPSVSPEAHDAYLKGWLDLESRKFAAAIPEFQESEALGAPQSQSKR